MSNVEIELPPPGEQGGKIAIDGHDIAEHVRGFTLEASALRGARLTLDIPIHEVTRFESPHVQVRVDSGTQSMLERAGWTPPPGTGSALARDEDGCPCEWKETGYPYDTRPVLGRTVPTCPVHGRDA